MEFGVLARLGLALAGSAQVADFAHLMAIALRCQLAQITHLTIVDCRRLVTFDFVGALERVKFVRVVPIGPSCVAFRVLRSVVEHRGRRLLAVHTAPQNLLRQQVTTRVKR